MNPFTVFAYRFVQKSLHVALFFIKMPEPKRYSSLLDAPKILEEAKVHKPLIVCDSTMAKLPSMAKLVSGLEEAKVPYAIYSGVVPNPTFACIKAGLAAFNENECDCIISLGGGSSIDCAKSILTLIAGKKDDLGAFRGLLKVKGKLCPHIAIPTTAGSGSEATPACVVTDEEHSDKFAIESPKLIPGYAILDDSVLEGCPKKLIAATGMDAYTHALESYLNCPRTSKTKAYGIKAMQLLEKSLKDFYDDPTVPQSRADVQLASYLAGVAFSRAFVGYAHALSHSLGGTFHIAHGLANAVLLPYVVAAFGKKAYKKLAQVADAIGLCDASLSNDAKAKAFIEHLVKLNEALGSPKTFEGAYKKEDIPALVERAYVEANPGYPVPKILSRDELSRILEETMG